MNKSVGYHSEGHFHIRYYVEELLVLQPQTHKWLGEHACL